MSVTSANVKELRERTGAGMMDCKKALTESNGDMEAAVDWLRKKGLAAASKKSGRTAAEGLVGILARGTAGALVEVNAETDFVARNDQFQKFVHTLSEVALESPLDLDGLKKADYPGAGHSVEDELKSLIATIGENMNLRRLQRVEVKKGLVASYIHNVAAEGLGRVGVLVALESEGPEDKLNELGRKVAMHIAAAHPQARTVEELSPEVRDRERKIFAEQAAQSGKPAEFIDKIVEGRLRKFYEEFILLEQVFLVDDTKRKVSKVIEDAAQEMGAPVELVAFAHFKLGEGIEKKETDFAAEVAEQLKS